MQALLQSHVPTEDNLARPVALRSREEQRRRAFRAFLRRTWFDHALKYAERLLVLLLAGFFGFWLLDGYGRDWLHQHQGKAPLPAAAGPRQPPAAPTPAPEQARFLPFTSPTTDTLHREDNEDTNNREKNHTTTRPDYLVPQPVHLSPEPADQRPSHLSIPAIEVESAVVEVFVKRGTWQVAEYAAGYHHGTALPGEGNTVLSGHAGMRGSVFAHLGRLQPGDDLFLEAGGWRYHYQVRETQRVGPTRVEVMAPTTDAILTLITCTDWDTRRLVVVADLVGSRPLERN